MDEHNGFVQVPAEDFRLLRAQVQQTNIDAQNTAQAHAQALSELRDQYQQAYQHQASELADTKNIIQQLQSSQNHNYSKKPDAFRGEPRKFEGYGDNAETWILELESNFRIHHYPENEWGEMIGAYLDEESKMYWLSERSNTGGIITDYQEFRRKFLQKYNFRSLWTKFEKKSSYYITRVTYTITSWISVNCPANYPWTNTASSTGSLHSWTSSLLTSENGRIGPKLSTRKTWN